MPNEVYDADEENGSSGIVLRTLSVLALLASAFLLAWVTATQ